MFDLRYKPQNGLYVYERAVTLPDQYPDRFDQLVSAVGAIATRWIHSGTRRPSLAKARNERFCLPRI